MARTPLWMKHSSAYKRTVKGVHQIPDVVNWKHGTASFELSTGVRLPLTNRIDTFSARRAMNFSNLLSTAGFLASCAEWEDVGQLYKWPNFRLARALRRRSRRREEDYYPHVYVLGFLVVGIPKCCS